MRGEYILDKIKIHSVIDLITNSSTESFTCRTSMTDEAVFGVIQQVVAVYNTTHGTKFTMEDLSQDVIIDDGYVKITGDLTGPRNVDIPEGLLVAIHGIFGGNFDETC